MTKLYSIAFLAMFLIISTNVSAQNLESVASNSADTIETVKSREARNKLFFQKRDSVVYNDGFGIIYPSADSKSRKVRATVSFPKREITDLAPVIIHTKAAIYYGDRQIPAYSPIMGRVHFRNGRYYIEGLRFSYNGKDIYVHFDAFDSYDFKEGIIITPSGKQSWYLGSLKTQISIMNAKFDVELKRGENGKIVYKLTKDEVIPIFLLANYSDYYDTLAEDDDLRIGSLQ